MMKQVGTMIQLVGKPPTESDLSFISLHINPGVKRVNLALVIISSGWNFGIKYLDERNVGSGYLENKEGDNI